MKKFQVVILILCLAITGFSQTIYIANSAVGAVGGTNVFTGNNAINLAITAATNGDIIYVVPSGVVYLGPAGAVTKSLTITGGGFNPDKPGALRSTLNGFSIGTVSNFRLSGLDITSGGSAGITFSASPANIMIDKCRVRRIEAVSATLGNLIIENCIFGENTSFATPPLSGFGSSTNVRISNNIIYSNNTSVTGAINILNGALIENNIFAGVGTGTQSVFSSVTNCDIRNNIFYGIRTIFTGATFTGNTQQNNISFGASDNTFSTTGNTSISNIVGSDPLFVNLSFGTIYLISNNAQLQAASPAIGSGFGGTNMGIFGGTHPFDIYGTSLPIVQAITPPGTVTQGSTMNVRVQAKGN